MRMIDADALWEKMYKYSDNEGAKMPYGDDDSLIHRDSACFLIEEAPTITPEPHWIPVTERLPDKDGSYLVSGKWGSGKESVGDCEFSVEDGYFQVAWNFDVFAWMPLPEPFKEVTE